MTRSDYRHSTRYSKTTCTDNPTSASRGMNRAEVVAGQSMFNHILIATDGSEVATKAVSDGLKLAKKHAARVVVMTASEPLPATVSVDTIAANFPAEYEKATKASAAKILDEVRGEALTIGVECETLHVTNIPAEAIIQTARA